MRTYSFKEFIGQANHSEAVFRCHSCQVNMEAIYKVHMLVKDKSLFNVAGGVKCVLFTSDGVCEDFFNKIKP